MERETMSWVKIDDQLHSNPKVLQCSLAARGLWLMCLSWVGDKETDGVLPMSIARLHAGADYTTLSEELIEAGLWIEEGKNLIFKDYLEYNRSADQIEAEREATATRQGRFRNNRKKSNGVTHAVSNAVTSAPVTGAPVPVPVPGIGIASFGCSSACAREEEPQGLPVNEEAEGIDAFTPAELYSEPLPPPASKAQLRRAKDEQTNKRTAILQAFFHAKIGTALDAPIPEAEMKRFGAGADLLIEGGATPADVGAATVEALKRASSPNFVTVSYIAGNLRELLAPPPKTGTPPPTTARERVEAAERRRAEMARRDLVGMGYLPDNMAVN